MAFERSAFQRLRAQTNAHAKWDLSRAWEQHYPHSILDATSNA